MIFGSGLDRKEIFCSRFDCWKRGHIICELAGITTMVQQICDVSIKVVFEQWVIGLRMFVIGVSDV